MGDFGEEKTDPRESGVDAHPDGIYGPLEANMDVKVPGAKLFKVSNTTGSKFFVNSTLTGVSVFRTIVTNDKDYHYFFHREGNDFFSGDVAEILVYSRALSDTECQQVETYLNRKWIDPDWKFPSPAMRWPDLVTEYDPFLTKKPSESPQPPIKHGLNLHLDAEHVIKSSYGTDQIYQWMDRTNSTCAVILS